MEKSFLKIIILAVLIRLLLMPFLFHPDLKTHYYHANFLRQGVFNIYDYLKTNKDRLSYKQAFVYPPPIYFFQGTWLFLTSPFLNSEFTRWLNDWGTNAFASSEIFRFLFILKIPYFLFDLATGWTLCLLVNQSLKKRIFILWFFNPLTLYIIYGISNFDIIPTFLTLLSFYLFKKTKFLRSGLILGLACSFKFFPLMILLFLFINLILTKQYRKAYRFIGGVIITLGTPYAIWLNDINKILDSNLSKKFLELTLDLRFIKVPALYLLGTLLVVLQFIFKPKINSLNLFFVAMLLGALSITRFHPQWFIWVLPFLILLIIEMNISLVWLIILSISYAIFILGFHDNYLTLGIFSPLIKNIYFAEDLHTNIFALINEQLLIIFARILFILSSLSILFATIFKKGSVNKLPEKKLLFSLIFLSIFVIIGLGSLAIFYSSRKNLVALQMLSERPIPFYLGHDYFYNFNYLPKNTDIIYLRLKNVGLRNKDPLIFQLSQNKNTLREIKISGANFRDDTMVKFQFPPLEYDRHDVLLTLHSDTLGTSDTVAISVTYQLEPAYQIFKKDSFLTGWKNMIIDLFNNLSADKSFAVFYLLILSFTPLTINLILGKLAKSGILPVRR